MRRLWQWLTKRRVVVTRHPPIAWTVADGHAMRHFLQTETGLKLIAVLENNIVGACLDGRNSAYVRGMIQQLQAVRTMQAPPPPPPEEPEKLYALLQGETAT